MQYIENKLFVAVTGNPFVITTTDDKTEEKQEATIGKMLELLLAERT